MAVEEENAGLRRGWTPLLRYIESGNYSEQLRRYEEYFSPQQMKIILFDDWRSNPQQVWTEILEYLNVDEDSNVAPDFAETINPSRIETPLGRIVRPSSRFWWIVPKACRKQVGRVAGSLLWHRPKLSSELQYELTQRFYRDEIKQLQAMLGRDLSHWLSRK